MPISKPLKVELYGHNPIQILGFNNGAVELLIPDFGIRVYDYRPNTATAIINWFNTLNVADVLTAVTEPAHVLYHNKTIELTLTTETPLGEFHVYDGDSDSIEILTGVWHEERRKPDGDHRHIFVIEY